MKNLTIFKEKHFFALDFILTYFQFLTIIFPILFVPDFYLQTGYYNEQPQSTYTQKSILILHTNNGPKIWSSSGYLNSNIIPPTLFFQPIYKLSMRQETGLSRQVAIMRNTMTPNPDARVDNYNLNFKTTLSTGESVYGVEFLTYFYQKLDSKYNKVFHSAVYVNQMSPIAASSLKVMGEIRLKQKTPWNSYHSETAFNYTTTSFEDINTLSDLNLYNLVKDFYDREETGQFYSDVNIWTPGTGSTNFEFNLDISIPEWIVFYRSDFWESIKHAYVQFVAILLPILIVGWLVCEVLFSGGLMNTRLYDPLRKKNN